jgi:hypothetical protein
MYEPYKGFVPDLLLSNSETFDLAGCGKTRVE